MDLTIGITLAVLGAGFLHAAWNALLKSSVGGDATLDTAAVVAGSSMWGLAVVPFVGLPQPAAWPYMATSAVIHFGYYVTLAQAYRTGDLSFAYPLMRGTAPLIVTVLGSIFLRELPTAPMMLGILLISMGIVSIAFVRRSASPRRPPQPRCGLQLTVGPRQKASRRRNDATPACAQPATGRGTHPASAACGHSPMRRSSLPTR